MKHCTFIIKPYKILTPFLLDWIADGKVRSGSKIELMKARRKVFVNALNYCKKKNRDIISDKFIANKYKSKDSKAFWKEVKKRKTGGILSISEVDGKKNDEEIVKVFHDKFSAVTGVSVNSQLDVVTEFCPNVDFTNGFSSYCVKQAIKSLSTGVGYDEIHSNHLKFSSPAMIFIYAKLFNSCIIHNHVPSAMLAAVINPLIKNRSTNIRDSDNYRGDDFL